MKMKLIGQYKKRKKVDINARNIKLLNVNKTSYLNNITGGERGIRTLDTITRIHAFQACAFSHSATSPEKTYSN